MDKAAPRPSYGALELVDRQRRTSMMRCALIALSCVTAATLVVAIVALATATGSKDKHGPAPPAPPDTASMAYVASAVSLTVNPTVRGRVRAGAGVADRAMQQPSPSPGGVRLHRPLSRTCVRVPRVCLCHRLPLL